MPTPRQRRPERPRLLLVGSGGERYRRYLLSSISSQFEVWLATRVEPSWERPFLTGWLRAEVSNPEPVVEAARALHGARPVDGVLCWNEALILTAAHVTAALDLPGPSVDAVAACRDKHETRRRLDAAGVPQARSLAVRGIDEARRAAAEVGYPLVVKPRGLGASRGVVRVDRACELPAAWEQASAASYPGVPTYGDVLVEEYLDGPEISVDGIVADGRYHMIFVARKDVGLAPYFEETGHSLGAPDPLMTDPTLRALLEGAHRALGFQDGWTHSEVRLTATGLRIVEVNGRLGGDLIPYLGKLATGVDPGVAAATVAVGKVPVLQPTRQRWAQIRFLYPEQDCRIEQVSVEQQTLNAHPDVYVEAAALASPGTTLRLPPHGYVARVAYVLAAGADPAVCSTALCQAVGSIRYTAVPLDESRTQVTSTALTLGASTHTQLPLQVEGVGRQSGRCGSPLPRHGGGQVV